MKLKELEESGIELTAVLKSELISLQDVSEFFIFFNGAFDVAFKSEHFKADGSELVSSVAVEGGSIKTVIKLLKKHSFHVGVASSLAAAIIWAAATKTWDSVHIDTNVLAERTIYRIEIDSQLTALAETLNQSGKPWSIEMTARNPRFNQDQHPDLYIKLSGNHSEE